MIEQDATVISVDGDRVVVASRASSGCNACSAGGGCGVGVLGRLFGTRATHIDVTSAIAVEPGDDVIIGIREEALLMGSLWIYFVPLVLFILGGLVGQTVAENIGTGEWVALLGALSGGALGFRRAAAHARSQRQKPSYVPEILRRHSGGSVAIQPIK